MTELLNFGAGGLVVFALLKLVPIVLKGRNGHPQSSGEKPPEFWLAEFQRLHNEQQSAVEILRDLRDIQRDVSKSLTRLVTIAEKR